MIHTVQLQSQRYCKEYDTQKFTGVYSEAHTIHSFKCQVNAVLLLFLRLFYLQ